MLILLDNTACNTACNFEDQNMEHVVLMLRVVLIKALTTTVNTTPFPGQYHPEFPADSPWVTSVGGTMLGHHKTNLSQEVVWNDGIIGSGGGFSNRFSRPR